MLITVTFDKDWILGQRNDLTLPVDRLINFLYESYDDNIEILYKDFTTCVIPYPDSDDITPFIKSITNYITEQYKIPEKNNIFEITVTEPIETDEIYDIEVPDDDDLDFPVHVSDDDVFTKYESELNNLKINNSNPHPLEDSIKELIGADEFKDLVEEIMKVAPIVNKHNTQNVITQQAYLFSINDGNGLTHYLTILSKLFCESKIYDQCYVTETKLRSSTNSNRYDETIEHVISLIQGASRNHSPQLFCIDISEWMTKTNDPEFRRLLCEIDKKPDHMVVVFRIPFVEKNIVNGILKSLNDVLFVRDVSFVPFNNNELKEYAKTIFDKMKFTVEDDVWPIFDLKIENEKNDGRFYGLDTVRKVVHEFIYHKHLYNAINGNDDNVIKRNEVFSLVSYLKAEDNKPAIEHLKELVGMDTICTRIEEIVAQIQVALKIDTLNHPCIHMRFVGNPGTGKTTVARIVGKVLKEKGILRNGRFFEHAGRDFCGVYVGQTAPKTAEICRDAYGSVLFIDEAYSLYRGDASTQDYGREAIDTLIAEMENHRSDLVVIMAGYPDEMETLMQANPGLESRMPYVIEFPNYSRSQLFEIYMDMAKKTFSFDEQFKLTVKDYFDNLPDAVINAKDFSNARFVRNLFERTWAKAILRNQLSKDDSLTLIKEDFIAASSEKEFTKMMKKHNKTLGFI